MQETIPVGVDFGSLRCRGAYCSGEDVVTLPVEPAWADTSKWMRCGQAADTLLGVQFSSLKSLLGAEASTPGRADMRSQATIRRLFLALRLAANKHAGKSLGQLVVTVPALYSIAQRTALCKVASDAGFRDVQLLNDGMATAIGYVGRNPQPRTLLVISSGYMGMEAALIRVAKGRYRAMGYDGYPRASGWVFDTVIMWGCLQALAAQRVWSAERIMSSEHWLAFRNTAERLKEALSTEDTVELETSSPDEAGPLVRLRIERSAFERAATQFVSAGLDAVERTLLEAKLSARDLDEVLLDGGSCRMPLIAHLVEERFFRKAVLVEDTTAARGAALFASQFALLPAAEALPPFSEELNRGHTMLTAPPVQVGFFGDGVGSASGTGTAVKSPAVVLGFDLPAADGSARPSGAEESPALAREEALKVARDLIARGTTAEAESYLHALIQDARTLLQEVAEVRPATPHPEAEQQMQGAYAHLEAGRALQAVESAHIAYNSESDQPKIFQQMIDVHCRAAAMNATMDRYDDALRYLMCAYHHDRTNRIVHERLAARHFLHAQQAMDAGEGDVASRALSECMYFNPDHEEALKLKKVLEGAEST